ncbi:PTS sugar transporter subunit IIA [Psittacicella gerlachiana]|uniref:PTS system glucose-specific EIIA component n=1 Tax=Psittacicella gerlachiana TaxID=2028574 RepID=A0A3A1YHU1_9GAMM|nr:glucose PTS transporter subunit IIA [Psittacicella gerlachiana]RIY36768.1 hypothetical protein CKF59_02320 [Psittacicella gerlachiana]
MGLLKSIFQFFNKPKETTITILAPLSGTIQDLEEVSDIVFSDLILGDGIAIVPDKNQDQLLSPIEANVKKLYQTQHAIMLEHELGIDLFIHVGFNTLNLRGQCFNSLVVIEQKVHLNEPLLEIDFATIIQRGLETTTPIVVSNLNENILIINKASSGTRVIAGQTPIFDIIVKHY